MSIDAMKQALEALEFLALENFVELDKSLNVGPTHGRKAILALRAAIEKAERPWQGLTDDDIAQAMYRADAIITGPMQFKFAREIEAKLKEKNNG